MPNPALLPQRGKRALSTTYKMDALNSFTGFYEGCHVYFTAVSVHKLIYTLCQFQEASLIFSPLFLNFLEFKNFLF